MRNFLMFMLAAMFCSQLMAQSTTNDDILRRAEVPVFKFVKIFDLLTIHIGVLLHN